MLVNSPALPSPPALRTTSNYRYDPNDILTLLVAARGWAWERFFAEHSHLDEVEQSLLMFLRNKDRGSWGTIQKYCRIISEFFNYFEFHYHALAKDKPLRFAAVHSSHVEAFLDHALLVGNAVNTVNLKLAVLKSYYAYLQREDWIRYNPSANVARMRGGRDNREGVLSREEIVAMIRTAHNSPRDQLILKTLYYTGLRAAEIAALRWNSFWRHPESGAWSFRVLGKGSKERKVKAVPPLIKDLLQYREALYGAPRQAPLTGLGDLPLFPRLHNLHIPLRPDTVYRIVRRCAQLAGVDTPDRRVTPHVFRHTFATSAIRAGISLDVVQKDMGHASAATSLKYMHSYVVQDVSAADGIIDIS